MPGPKLTYIEGWRVVDLANEIFGFNGWSTSVTSLDIDFLDVHPETNKCCCGVSAIVRITLRDGTFHEDVGYGHTEGVRGKHAALEKCKKEAITDSIKRGLKTFGRVLGNCLYDRQYAREVLRMPAAPEKLSPMDLHRSSDGVRVPQAAHAQPPKRAGDENASSGAKRAAHDERATAEDAKQARLRQAAAAREAVAARAAQRQTVKSEEEASLNKAAALPAQETRTSHCEAPRSAETTAASPVKEAQPDDDLWLDDAEAATMALELELEDEMLMRQSQQAVRSA